MASKSYNQPIRPGSFSGSYSYYGTRNSSNAPEAKVAPKKHHGRLFFILIVLLVLAAAGYNMFISNPSKSVNSNIKTSNLATKTPVPKTTATPVVSTATAATNACASNTLSQLVLVSISKQHLWACNYKTVLYDSAVVTGDEQEADTLTPPGTYHIYGKETDQTLKGSSSIGSWSDYVNYWMPFLDNQYGAYGFHDATWRAPTDFGNVNINSSDASHGCVELPLATAKWLFNWVVVGTTVTVES